jgi:hypothetical protein
MAMISKVAALELKLNSNSLPLPSFDLALRLTIGEARLNSFNKVPEFACNHSEEKDQPLLIDRLVP